MTCTSICAHVGSVVLILSGVKSAESYLEEMNFCTSLSISCKVILYLCVYLSICINSNNLLVSGPNVKHHIKCNQPQPCLNTLYIATICAHGYGLLSIFLLLAFHPILIRLFSFWYSLQFKDWHKA